MKQRIKLQRTLYHSFIVNLMVINRRSLQPLPIRTTKFHKLSYNHLIKIFWGIFHNKAAIKNAIQKIANIIGFTSLLLLKYTAHNHEE